MSLSQRFPVPCLQRHTDISCYSPGGQVDHQGLGILGGLVHPETEFLDMICAPTSTSPSS